MALEGRVILVAIGAAAVGGLLFGMMLGLFSPARENAPPVAGSGGTSGSPAAGSAEPSESPDDSETETESAEATCEDRPDDDFGFIQDVEQDDDETILVFDRSILYTGERAREEAQRRGNEYNGSYYIVNDNTRLRERAVSDDVTATGSVMLTGDTGPTDISPDDVYDFVRAHRGQLPVYLRYDPESCDVLRIEEVYLP